MDRPLTRFARAFTLAVALFAAAPLSACAPKAAAPSPAIWRLSDEDTTIWMFGTVHLLPPGLKWRSARVNDAFAAAGALVIETDTGPDAQQHISDLARAHGYLPAGQTLSPTLASDDAARLARIAQSLNVPQAALEPMRPWLAALTLSVAAAQKAGYDENSGVESVLLRDAAARQMPVRYMESAEDQINALAGLSSEDERKFLTTSLRQIEDDPDAFEKMDQVWVSGDAAALAALVEPDLRAAGPAVYDAVISNRNAAWTDKIATMLDEPGVVFVAVGAAHLVGEGGVPERLRARGLAVEGP